MKRLLPGTLWIALLLSSPTLAGDDPLFRIEEVSKWGFINRSGDVVIEPIYDDCYYQFSEGLAAVKVNGKWGYIDRRNHMVIPAKFDSANRFREGIALVRLGSWVAEKGKNAFIDKSGEFVLGPWDRWTSHDFREGLIQDKVDERWGYLDRSGRIKIPHRFTDTNNFSEGLAGVVAADATAGFIDLDGNYVIRLEDAAPHYLGFAEGLAPVRDIKTGLLGYIDRSGDWVIPPKFSDGREFSHGRAAVEITTEDETGWPMRHWGVIDKEGNITVGATFDTIWSYEDEFAVAILDGKWGFLDVKGDMAIPCRFDSGTPFYNGLAYMRMGDDQDTSWSGYINRQGEYVWRPKDFAAKDLAREKAKADKLAEEANPSIKVLTDKETKEQGLLVTYPKKIPFNGDEAGRIPLTIVNLLDEEVFIEVTGSESLSYSLEHWGGGFSGGGGSFTIFPDNTNLLKRLHATSYKDGKRFTCGCCLARINTKLDADVLDVGRARGTVTVWIRGFYRNSGKRFSESVDLSIEIVEQTEGQQDGAGQPPTRPESE